MSSRTIRVVAALLVAIAAFVYLPALWALLVALIALVLLAS